MCYMLYGAVNREADGAALDALNRDGEYRFRAGTKHDVKMSCANDTLDYRLTDWQCACDFPIGMHNPDAPELRELEQALLRLRSVAHLTTVYLSKTWTGTRNKTEQTVRLDEVDLRAFLAEGRERCLYTILY